MYFVLTLTLAHWNSLVIKAHTNLHLKANGNGQKILLIKYCKLFTNVTSENPPHPHHDDGWDNAANSVDRTTRPTISV